MWNVRWCAICEGNISSLVNVNLINRATIKQEHARSITPTWFRPRVLLSNTHTHPFQEWFPLQYSIHFWSIWDPLHTLLNNLISLMFPMTKFGSIAFWFLSFLQQLRIQQVSLYQAWFTNCVFLYDDFILYVLVHPLISLQPWHSHMPYGHTDISWILWEPKFALPIYV